MENNKCKKNMITIQKKVWVYLFLIFSSGLMFEACKGPTDSSEPFVKPNEIIYLAKSDSVQVLSGRNRVILKIGIPADPHITRIKIKWNNSKDSVVTEIPVNKKFLTVEIDNLKEGLYTFHIYTIGSEGNTSLGQAISGRTYGQIYESSLMPRAANDVKLDLGSGYIIVNWGRAPDQMIGTMLIYNNKTNKKSTLFVSNDSVKTTIRDFRIGSNIQIKSLFLPDSTAIDTFYSDVKTVKVKSIMIPNSIYPIQHAVGEYDGKRRGNPAVWNVNSVIRGRIIGKDGKKYGGWDGLHEGGYLTMSTQIAPPFKNGKIYQTYTLPKGNYTFKARFDHQDGVRQESNVNRKQYIVVAKGKSLPNINKLNRASLGFSKFEQPSVQFTLSKPTKISFGFVCSYTRKGSYFRASSVILDVSH